MDVKMEHSPLRIIVITLALLCDVTLGVLCYLFAHRPWPGVFTGNASAVLQNYILPITPPSWTFYAWWPINAWQVTWLLYAMTTTCRKSGDGALVYRLDIVSPVVYGLFLVADLLMVAWLFAWEREMAVLAFILALLMQLCLYSAMISTCQSLYKKRAYMNKNELTKDITLTQVLVQNGIGCYATWITMGALLNFSITMAYECDVDKSTASLVSLIILSIQSVSWLLVDVTVFDNQVRYVVSPYVIGVFGIVSVTMENVALGNMTAVSLVTIGLLVCTSLQLVVKVTLTVWRHKKHPLKNRNSYDLNVQRQNTAV